MLEAAASTARRLARPQFGLRSMFVATAAAAVAVMWCITFGDVLRYPGVYIFRAFCLQYLLLLGTIASISRAVWLVRGPDNRSTFIGWLAVAWLSALMDSALGMVGGFYCMGAPNGGNFYHRMYVSLLPSITIALFGSLIVLVIFSASRGFKFSPGRYLFACVAIAVIDVVTLLLTNHVLLVDCDAV